MYCLYSFQAQVGAHCTDYDTKLPACAIRGTEIQITGRAVSIEGLLWTEMEMRNNTSSKTWLWEWFSVQPTWGWDSVNVTSDSCSLFIVFYEVVCTKGPQQLCLGFTPWFAVCKNATRECQPQSSLCPVPKKTGDEIQTRWNSNSPPPGDLNLRENNLQWDSYTTPHPLLGVVTPAQPSRVGLCHSGPVAPALGSSPTPVAPVLALEPSPGTGTQPSVTPSPQHRQTVKDATLLKMGF